MLNLKKPIMGSVMRSASLFIVLLWIVLLGLNGCLKTPKPSSEQTIASTSQASVPCIDTLAAAKYPEALTAIPVNFAIGGFAKTFGDFFPVAKRELDKGRRYIRVNLLWSDTHTYGDKDIPAIRKEAKRYQILCNAYPHTTIELAPFTEHNLKKPDKYLKVVQNAAPSCGVVNSVWKGSFSKVYKNEIHGTTNNKPLLPYNYSYDGTNSVDSDVVAMLRKHSEADIFCMWHPRLNGKWSMSDPTPRPQRTAWPTKEMLRSLVYLFTDKGDTNIPKTWLVKSHAERHSREDLKGDKLLIISPIKDSEIVLRRDGEKVDTLPYYGAFSEGGWRYYSPVMGYQLGADLDVFIETQKYGRINGGFRDPTYR